MTQYEQHFHQVHARHDEPRLGVEAITARIGAISLSLSIILFVVATAIFHPHREDPMDNQAVFREYAQYDGWIADHFAQWVAVLLLIGSLVALYYALTRKPNVAAIVARFGLAAALLAGGAFTMLQAVDGVALKWAVDAWASAPAAQQDAAFAAALTVRWTGTPLSPPKWLHIGPILTKNRTNC